MNRGCSPGAKLCAPHAQARPPSPLPSRVAASSTRPSPHALAPGLSTLLRKKSSKSESCLPLPLAVLMEPSPPGFPHPGTAEAGPAERAAWAPAPPGSRRGCQAHELCAPPSPCASPVKVKGPKPAFSQLKVPGRGLAWSLHLSHPPRVNYTLTPESRQPPDPRTPHLRSNRRHQCGQMRSLCCWLRPTSLTEQHPRLRMKTSEPS